MVLMKEIQKKIKDFCKENNLKSPIEHRLLDTMSELGEVAKEVLKMSNYGRKSIEYREEFKDEIGDAFFSLITVANSFDIDLEEALEEVLEKYNKRAKKGSIDSKN